MLSLWHLSFNHFLTASGVFFNKYFRVNYSNELYSLLPCLQEYEFNRHTWLSIRFHHFNGPHLVASTIFVTWELDLIILLLKTIIAKYILMVSSLIIHACGTFPRFFFCFHINYYLQKLKCYLNHLSPWILFFFILVSPGWLYFSVSFSLSNLFASRWLYRLSWGEKVKNI